MLAFVIEQPGDKVGKVVQVDKPKLDGPGFCLIRVLRAGVCNTDLELLQGYMGFSGILGHEFVGVVEEVHDERHTAWIGKRVCGDINVSCDACQVCHNTTRRNDRCSQFSRNHCPNRSVLGILQRNGTMAEYLTLPVRNLHIVPDHLSNETAVFAEPLAAACRIAEQDLISYDEPHHVDRVAILGDGKLGLLIAEVLGRQHMARLGSAAALYPAPVLFGKHAHKLELISGSGVETRMVEECYKDGNSHTAQFDVVVDATGSPAGLSLAAKLCRPMGTIVLKSTCAAATLDGQAFNTAPFVIDELKVVGSRCGPIERALELLAAKDATDSVPLHMNKYVTKTFPLAQADEAIRCAAEKSTMKVQIICSEESSSG